MKFRKKPVVIEAVQYWYGTAGISRAAVEAMVAPNAETPFFEEDGSLKVWTAEGVMKVSDGDYVIKGVKGEFYPCKPDIFAATYEPVAD